MRSLRWKCVKYTHTHAFIAMRIMFKGTKSASVYIYVYIERDLNGALIYFLQSC